MTETSTEPSSITYEDNVNEVLKEQEGEVEKENMEKKFITSPADIEVHGKVDFQDADISDKQQQAFKDLCVEFNDILSTDSGDIGKNLCWKLKLILVIVCQSPKNPTLFLETY